MGEKTREWTTFGRYVLLEKIGVGGMAEILRAKVYGAAGFEKEFAIKLILPGLIDDREFVDMFINEAKIAVNLYHTNIVQVFDLGQIEGQYFIAMEYVHGKDLLDVLARCAEYDLKIPLHLVLFATMEMLKGLDFAHRAKDPFGEDLSIVHRDVSPSNVLISYAGDVKIGDFGVAKATMQRTMTESGTLKGKVGYMSPEQVMGERLDARSDVFAAGIVFFEALSMSRLFTGSSDLNVMLKVRDADIMENLAKAGPLPSELVQIVHKALARHREERYQSAGEFYQALMDFCFHHNVKVTESDLSNFMRRLFAREIEEEKALRLRDPQHSAVSPMLSASADASSSSMGVLRGAGRRAGAAAPAPANAAPEPAPLIPTSVATPAPPAAIVARTLAASPPQTDVRELQPLGQTFRYRATNGLIYGPMTLTSLITLLQARPPQAQDAISVDGATWKAWRDAAELRDALERGQLKLPELRASQLDQAMAPPSLSEEGASDQALDESLMPASDSVSDSLGDSTLDDAPGTTSFFRRPSRPIEPPAAAGLREISGVVEDIKQRYTIYEGSFDQLPFARQLARLHRIKSTGRLNVRHGDVEKSIFFQKGQLILVDSNREDELLGTFLIRRKIITQAQLEQGLERLSEWGGRLGDALVAIGAIPAHDIFRLLSEQMSEKLLEVFTWSEGSFGYYENQEPETHGYPLDVDCFQIIVQGCRDRVPFSAMLAMYRDRLNVALMTRSPQPFAVDQLRLRGNELRVANQFASEGISLKELIHRFTPVQREVVYRTVYLLHQTELLTFESTQEQLNFPDAP